MQKNQMQVFLRESSRVEFSRVGFSLAGNARFQWKPAGATRFERTGRFSDV